MKFGFEGYIVMDVIAYEQYNVSFAVFVCFFNHYHIKLLRCGFGDSLFLFLNPIHAQIMIVGNKGYC